MGLVLMTLGLIGVVVGVLVLIDHFYEGSSADLIDWKPTRSAAVEAQNEVDDVQQMVEAQNEMRRRRGAGDLDEVGLRAEVEREEQEKLQRRNSFEAS